MQIRWARGEDASRLSTIAQLAKAHLGYHPEQLARWRDALTLTPASIDRLPSFVAVVDEIIAGFCQLDNGTDPWVLEHLWVHPHYLRRGIGRALLSFAGFFAMERGMRALAIDAEPAAEAFYLACGAQRVATTPAPIAGHPERVRPQLLLFLR